MFKRYCQLYKVKPLGFSILVAIIVFIGVVVFAAWSDPTATPPSNNTDVPLNISNGGQVKSGPLGILTDNYDLSYGLTVGYSGNPIGIKATGNSFFEGNSSFTGLVRVRETGTNASFYSIFQGGDHIGHQIFCLAVNFLDRFALFPQNRFAV